jgi:serine protease AprX
LLLVVAVLIPYLGSATLALAGTPSGPLKAQSQLLQLASAQPAATVSVIVQKAGAGSSLEAMVSDLGGHVTQNLSIINAFSAELPASAVRQLASAEEVRWVSLNAAVVDTGNPGNGNGGGNNRGSGSGGGPTTNPCPVCIDTSNLQNAYVRAVGADRLWNEPPYLQGQGVTVAVLDSGITNHRDLKENPGGSGPTRTLTDTLFNSFTFEVAEKDKYGHGTHVAGIIGGNGAQSQGAYIGIAPRVNLLNVKIGDDVGKGTTADVVAGLQWVYENKDLYNIRVVNLSLNSSVPESYLNSPLSAAIEILWFNGIVVVASAGNNGLGAGNGILYPPANDPFVITVGATDDRGTANIGDDVVATYSAFGVTAEGITKPDLVAPGTNIISLLAKKDSDLDRLHRNRRIAGNYFRMSGTSMSAPVVAGAVALLLQDEPGLTPDQVKYRLMATARPMSQPGAGAGLLDTYAAVHGATTESANTGTQVTPLLFTGDDAVAWESVNWGSVNWGSVNWGSVNWGSVNWGSVNWGTVNWGSTYWGP